MDYKIKLINKSQNIEENIKVINLNQNKTVRKEWKLKLNGYPKRPTD